MMNANILPLFFRSPARGDWTQQELAEFYRVETILMQSGISLDTDRGVSDEGDPWFVFCRPETGDVIIHFARHGSEYVAAGGGIDRVLRGRSFRDIVDSFVAEQPLVMRRPAGDPKVFLHPAALLSAFVATAFFLFIGADAEAAEAHGADAAKAAPRDSLPASFQALLEAAGLIGNREAWIALGAVSVALTVAMLEFTDSPARAGETDLFADAGEAQRAEHAALAAMLNDGDFGSFEGRAARRAEAMNAAAVQEAAAQEEDQQPALHTAETTRVTRNAAEEAPFSTEWKSADQALIIAARADGPQVSPSLDGAAFFEEDVSAQATRQEEATASHAEPAESQALQIVQESMAAQFAQHSSVEVLSPAMMNALVNAMHADFYQAGAFAAVVVAVESEDALSAQQVGFAAQRADMAYDASSDRFAVFEEHGSPETALEALEWFAAANPDYKVVSLGRNVIVFDWADLAAGKQLHVHVWAMGDGSTVNIIGSLPDFDALAA
jgi:hypothetical protein